MKFSVPFLSFFMFLFLFLLHPPLSRAPPRLRLCSEARFVFVLFGSMFISSTLRPIRHHHVSKKQANANLFVPPPPTSPPFLALSCTACSGGKIADYHYVPGFIRVEPGEGRGVQGRGEEWFEWEILLSRYSGGHSCVLLIMLRTFFYGSV